MPDVVLRNATDTFANIDAASRNYRQSRSISLKSGAHLGYLYFNRAAPRGSNITHATLRLYHRNGWGSSSRDITVKRIDEPWQASRLTWNNRPVVVGAGRSVADTGGPDGTVVEIDVTGLLQLVSNGARWLGFRIETDDATARELYSSNADKSALRPTLQVAWTLSPQAPTDLSPAGGRCVSIAKPTLRFTFVDELGDTSLSQVRVQMDPTDTAWDTPTYDSGPVDAEAPELDLSETGFAGISDGGSMYWRARVCDGAGLWSDWSDSARFERHHKGTLTILSPPNVTTPTVGEPSPPIIWDFTGRTQKAWQVQITDDADHSKIRADSDRQKGVEESWTVPDKKLKDDRLYQVTVRVWDTIDREGTPGDPVFTYLRRTFAVADNPGVTPVSSLAVTQLSLGKVEPRMELTWQRSSAPDRFVILRNGNVIERLDAADVILPGDGTHYSYIDDNARPWRESEWRVKAIENSEQSAPRIVVETPRSIGIWLFDKGRDLRVWIADKQSGAWTMGEEATVFAPLNGSKVVRHVQSQRGLEGTISGLIVTKFNRDWWQWERDLLDMRDEPNNAVTISMADLSIRAIIGNITTYPTTSTPPSRQVSLDFWEVD